ncbi:hypothetical protein [Streptomyces roseoverticillatus]|uniref:Uncharacterized protein n=1 Tax=Streptomyces roseoverticillatus TaxID=66429 RepID=A0ABV3ITL9_9ACTN
MRRPAFTVTANGSYAARLALDGATGGWFPERWTLDGPEPYAVPLPGSQPEEPDSEVQPLADGRVLIRRRVAERHTLSLLYPTGPGTGELPVGAVECARLSLLPPAPGGASVYGLVHAERATALWRLHGGSFGPERVVDVPGRCTGGAWLDRTGRLLALDRELDGRTKTVVVDLERGGETSPLLQITEDSNDRLLLADPYSGLLLVRSDAPGQDRLGWGVLGSARPVRFPECLRPAGAVLTPFATQPGQELTPEGCAVAFRVEGATGSWVGVWRPSGKQLQQFPAPAGWLVGAGLWTSGGELRLPFVTPYVRCGLARLRLPEAERGETRDTAGRGGAPSGAGPAAGAAEPAAPPPGAPSAPQPLPQVPRAAPEQAAPPLHEVPRPGLTQEQPLLQAPPRTEPGPSGAGAQVSPGAPQAPLLREAEQPVPRPEAVVPPLLHEASRAASPMPSRPEPGVAKPPQSPLLHKVSRPASPPLPWPEASVAVPPESPLLREAKQPVSPLPSRPETPAAAPLLQEAPRPASPPLSRPEPDVPAPSQPVPLLQEVPRPVPCPEPQFPSMRDVPRADETPQADRPAHHEHAPPQDGPLLERPHEGLSPGVPQAGPQGPVSMPPAGAPARSEAPASVWTAVDPAGGPGLSGAPMPGAWSVAASRPVPLQQAPLGREPRA